MNVLFLSSHSLGRQALAYLESCDGWDNIDVKITGELDPYPDDYQLGISFLYNYLIPAKQLCPDRTWINFHPAPLPEYRGRNVAYHAIMNGETEFGATLHYVDKTFDTGDIIDIRKFMIYRDYHAGNVAEVARKECLALFYEWIPRFLKGERPVGRKQVGGTYYKKSSINSNVLLLSEQVEQIRAITAPPHYATTDIYGVKYAIIPASELYSPDDESSFVAQANADRAV